MLSVLSVPKDRDFLRLCAFMVALFIYGLFGSPTPDRPGAPEILISCLLLFSIGISGLISSVYPFFSRNEALWLSSGKALLLFGALVPLCMAAFNGHSVGQVLRDMAGFFFLLLPVFMIKNFKNRPVYSVYLLMGVMGVGFAFALRSLMHSFPFNMIAGHFFSLSDELFYFSNAASVLLVALFLIGRGGVMLMDARKGADILQALVAFSLLAVPVLAMILSVQRATLGAAGLYIVILLGAALWRRPVAALRVLGVLVLVGVIMLPMIHDVSFILMQKTLNVGFNMRFAEIMAVWEHVSGNIWSLLFGMGWGASFHSPAVGGLSVYYTHNLFSYMLLKTGLIGAGLSAVYILGLLGQLSRLILMKPVIGVALAAPIFIDIFFYASFKSLDFGLVLLLIPSLLFYARSEHICGKVLCE